MNLPKDYPQELMTIIIVMMAVVFITFAAVYFFYLLSVQNLLKAVRPVNRKMQPGQVWLLLISCVSFVFVFFKMFYVELMDKLGIVATILPLLISVFVLVWQFYMVNKVADSIEAEYLSRNLPVPARPTYQTGLFYCICNTVGLVGNVPFLSFFALLAGIAGFVAWILYWVKIAEWKNHIKVLPPANDGESALFKDLY